MRHIVFSNYINAWSIKEGLKKLNKQLEVYSLTRKRNVINHTIEEVPLDSTLFFTEESSLKKYVNSKTHNFYPEKFPASLLDDKYKFAKFLLEINEKPVPQASIHEAFDYPLFLKAKHSWKEDLKLPRGYICEDEEQYRYYKTKLIRSGLQEDWFFKQKLLTSPIQNNISASGFFDSDNNKRNIIIITKKAMGDSGKIATGIAVKTIRDPADLIIRTTKILNELNYTGPFELEFFYEESDNEHYVLELNPRFWMQHGLFIDFYDNAIIKRYLNLDKPSDWIVNGTPDFKEIVWINNLFYIESIIKRNTDIIRRIKDINGEKKHYPNIRVSFKYFFNLLMNKLKKQ